MYFPDLSPYTYTRLDFRSVNVGWLDARHPFPTAEPEKEILERLELYCQYPQMATFGHHDCEFCNNANSSAEIRVFGRDERYYAAPILIFHYVARHHYRPPDEFLQALKEGPLPGTADYKEFCSWCVNNYEEEKDFMTQEQWEAYVESNRPKYFDKQQKGSGG